MWGVFIMPSRLSHEMTNPFHGSMSCGIACHEDALANVWGYGTEEGKRFFYAATAEWTAANSIHRDNDSRTEQVTVTPHQLNEFHGVVCKRCGLPTTESTKVG
jgi:hypothetical protein